jgi:seryl-tRNA synthetase
MIDIEIFRKNPQVIYESEKKRMREKGNIDNVIKYDELWRDTLKEVENLRKYRNEVSKVINEIKKKGESGEEKIKEMREVNDKIKELEEKVDEYLENRDEYRYKVGNLLHKDVPVGDETQFKVLRENEKREKKKFELKSHSDLIIERNLANLEKASEVSGARFYYLKAGLAELMFALTNYATEVLLEEGYTLVRTPYMLREQYMKKAAELGDFKESLYKIEGEDLYLIATSEQSLAVLHADETIEEKELPIRYISYSPCFRKEAGSHGKDTKGLFRVHHFDKIEQFVFTKPEESLKEMEKMIKITEKIVEGLGFHYRTIDIASGDLNDNASRKYDIEIWMPVQETYRELMSCSNLLDYQARKLNIKMNQNNEKVVLHTLNSTGLPIERCLVGILENYQNEDGSITIPEKLRKYMRNREKI